VIKLSAKIRFLLQKTVVKNPFTLANYFCIGRGVEIGALSNPFPFARAKVTYADIAGVKTMRAYLDQIPIDNLYSGHLVKPGVILKSPRYGFETVPDNEYDFVYSSHCIEHAPNPLYSIKDQLRIVRPGGVVYGIIPNKALTYDKRRKTTPLQTLVYKYENDVFHHSLEEAMDVVENTFDHPLYKNKGIEYAKKIAANGQGIHHFHVFDPSTTMKVLVYITAEFNCSLEYFCVEGINMHFCLRKG
jgi:SAM-dependent methyltransferase